MINTRFNYKYTESKNNGINRAVRITNPIKKTLGGEKSDVRVKSITYEDVGNICTGERIDWYGSGTEVIDTNFIGSVKVEILEHRN